MAVALTSLGFKKPDGNELFKQGDNVIADNAQKADDILAAVNVRLGLAEANIDAGSGYGPGLSEDPLNPGTYFMADESPITPDPENPGLYTF
jgi:hypothetical protein